MSISLAGTDAWAVGEQLVPDTYRMKFVANERTESKSGNPQVQVDLRVQSGSYKGAEQRDYITFTEGSRGRVKQILLAIDKLDAMGDREFNNYDEMADAFAELLKEQPMCDVLIRLEPGIKDPSKEWPKVAGYRKPDPSDITNDASGFASGPKTKTDDDLPF